MHKLVFLVFFKSAAIEGKIKKICDAFGARRYPVPDMDNATAVRQLMDDNYGDLHDARLVLLKVSNAAATRLHASKPFVKIPQTV